MPMPSPSPSPSGCLPTAKEMPQGEQRQGRGCYEQEREDKEEESAENSPKERSPPNRAAEVLDFARNKWCATEAATATATTTTATSRAAHVNQEGRRRGRGATAAAPFEQEAAAPSEMPPLALVARTAAAGTAVQRRKRPYNYEYGGGSNGDDDNNNSNSNNNSNNNVREALRHVLFDVVRFPRNSSVVRAYHAGLIDGVDQLCHLEYQYFEDVFPRHRYRPGDAVAVVRGAVEATAAAAADDDDDDDGQGALKPVDPTAAGDGSKELDDYGDETEKRLAQLKRFRAHLKRTVGGGDCDYPTSADWRSVSEEDFANFAEEMTRAEEEEEATAATAARHRAQQMAKRFVKSITGDGPEPILGSNEMFVMKNVVKIESESVSDVVVRKLTRPFWQACIDAVNTPGVRRRVCAVGTPGIGKTTSTPYLIRMLLLEQRETVVYHQRSRSGNRFVYEIVPTINKNSGDAAFTVNAYPERDFDTKIPSLKRPSTFYVVDTGKFTDSCDLETDDPPKVIIVASPDSKHWGGNEFYKERDGVVGVLKVFPVWQLDELLQARSTLGPNLTEQQVRDRYWQVGGVPRHIFTTDDEVFDMALTNQTVAVNTLTTQQVDAIANLHMSSVTTFDKSQPQSALIGFRLAANDKGNFSRYSVDPISQAVVTTVYQKFLTTIWLDLHSIVGGALIFEAYTRLLMVGGPCRFKFREGVGWFSFARLRTKFMELGGCEQILAADDIIAEARAKPLIVFRPLNPAEKLIDFVYRDRGGHFHAFQATVGKKHSASIKNILELEKQVGGPYNVSLYYLVPEWQYFTFVTDPVNPRSPRAGARPTCQVYHVAIPAPPGAGVRWSAA